MAKPEYIQITSQRARGPNCRTSTPIPALIPPKQEVRSEDPLPFGGYTPPSPEQLEIDRKRIQREDRIFYTLLVIWLIGWIVTGFMWGWAAFLLYLGWTFCGMMLMMWCEIGSRGGKW